MKGNRDIHIKVPAKEGELLQSISIIFATCNEIVINFYSSTYIPDDLSHNREFRI